MERVTSLPRGGLLQAARPALAGARLEAVPGFDRSVVDRARRIGGQLETGRVDAGRVLCRPRRLELSGSSFIQVTPTGRGLLTPCSKFHAWLVDDGLWAAITSRSVPGSPS